MCAIGQSGGIQNDGADFSTTRGVSGDESGASGIRSGNDGSARGTREDDTGAILVGSSHNVSGAGTTSAATRHRGFDRADDVAILVDSNTGDR